MCRFINLYFSDDRLWHLQTFIVYLCYWLKGSRYSWLPWLFGLAKMTWRWSLNLELGLNFPWERGLGFKWSRVLIRIPICIIVHQLSRCMVAKLMISVQAISRVLICIPICIIVHQLLGYIFAKLVISFQK